MERDPNYPLTPQYMESYIHLVYAAYHPDEVRAKGAKILDVDAESLESIFPSIDDTEQLQGVLTEVLGNSLRATANDLSIEQREDITEEDFEWLMIYSLGAWPDAIEWTSDLPFESRIMDNPLADIETVRQIWRYIHDRRHALPSIERLIPNYGDWIEEE